MTLALRGGETVIHVGAGTGYYSALLARLVGPTGHVHAYEIDGELAERARNALSDHPNVSVHARSAVGGSVPEADAIYVNAGATFHSAGVARRVASWRPPAAAMTPAAGPGAMLLVTRTSSRCFDARFVCAAMFIPCVGARTDASAARLGEAFRRGDAARVRSLRRGGEPDSAGMPATAGGSLPRVARLWRRHHRVRRQNRDGARRGSRSPRCPRMSAAQTRSM